MEVTDANGCSSVSMPYTIWVGIEEAKEQGFNIYPNPVRDDLFIEATKDYNLSLLDITGKELRRLSVYENLTQISVTELPPGIYLIEIEYSEGRFGYKFVRH